LDIFPSSFYFSTTLDNANAWEMRLVFKMQVWQNNRTEQKKQGQAPD
jgi:hypothetical protein